jgi:pyruvate carboxylase
MPGLVEKILVSEGQSVKAGDVLCTISAMKMEVKITSPVDTVIQTVHSLQGARVIEGALLITLH